MINPEVEADGCELHVKEYQEHGEVTDRRSSELPACVVYDRGTVVSESHLCHIHVSVPMGLGCLSNEANPITSASARAVPGRQLQRTACTINLDTARYAVDINRLGPRRPAL